LYSSEEKNFIENYTTTIKNKTMYDLFDFYQKKIQQLGMQLAEQEDKITKLETYVFELCDKDCPEEYKQVVKKDVFDI
jgi:hypothetical protein